MNRLQQEEKKLTSNSQLANQQSVPTNSQPETLASRLCPSLILPSSLLGVLFHSLISSLLFLSRVLQGGCWVVVVCRSKGTTRQGGANTSQCVTRSVTLHISCIIRFCKVKRRRRRLFNSYTLTPARHCKTTQQQQQQLDWKCDSCPFLTKSSVEQVILRLKLGRVKWRGWTLILETN